MSIQTKEAMVRWVQSRVADHPTLGELSAYVGYSPFYCSAKFREHTGMTYKRFLSLCRLRAAADDLAGTADSITDIAFRYGYSSSEAFARTFGAAYRCSPRAYRKSF